MSGKITVVVPVYNEQDSLNELCRQVLAIAKQQSYDLSLLLVDDGSTDQSWTEIQRLCRQQDSVGGIRLRRNFGKAAALSAGFFRATGSIVITMDADLQDDPAEIPNLIKFLDCGFDVVSGWKQVRNDPWHKVLPSRLFNLWISRLTGVHLHDHNCGLKAYRRQVLEEIQLYGEMHRFIPVLAASRGFRVGETIVEHRPRRHGQSKYGMERFIKGFLDLLTVYFLTGYGNRPQHLLGSLGLLSFSAGGFGLVWLASWWLVSRLISSFQEVHLHQKASFYFCILAVLLGIQLISIGFLAELLTALVRPQRKPYSIADQILPNQNAHTAAEKENLNINGLDENKQEQGKLVEKKLEERELGDQGALE